VAIVNLTAGGLSGGYLKYLRHVVPRLRSHPEIESLAVFAPATVRAQLADQGWPLDDWPAEDVRSGFKRLKLAVRDRRPEVIFIPTASWLDFGGTPVVVMVRNMEPLEAPFGGNPWSEAVRNLARRAVARRACRRAARVIAVSEHVREYVTSRWTIPREKVPLVYHGVEAADTTSAATIPSALARNPPTGFLFTAGSIRPARGLEDLVAALPHLDPEGTPSTVVVAGRADTGTERYQQRLIADARRLGVGDRIIWTGALTESEMRWCFRRCAAFIMTSRAEACPNLALEAMSHGCACVSVDRAPMPEFFRDAAVYYRAGDAAALARAILKLRPADRIALGEAAVSRARTFDWETTVQRTVTELRAALHP
jgi:glycosyltransferase involved in cell wall biosynthesis